MMDFGAAFALLRNLIGRRTGTQVPFSELYTRFQNIVQKNNAAMKLIADMDGKIGGDFVFDKKYLSDCINELVGIVRNGAYDLNFITNNQYLEIYGVIESLAKELETELLEKIAAHMAKRLYYLNEIEEGMEDIVGYKAYNLSRIINLPGVNVPRSFVVTVGGFRDYMAYNNLFEKIENLVEKWKRKQTSVEAISDGIRLMILGGEIPPELRRNILSASKQICDGKPETCYFSIRSSAVGEDGYLSFAGLHDSFLNVNFDELFSNFKKVLASLYSQASLEYRQEMKLFSAQMAMPVLYQKMIGSQVSGVLYTLDPNEPEGSESIVSGGWGLGEVAVGGEVPVDTFRVSRSPPYSVLERKIGSKAQMLAPFKKGPLQNVPGGLKRKPCLKPEEAGRIVEMGLALEAYFKKPLDVEWAVDDTGQLWILQARQINIVRPKRMRRTELKSVLEGHRVLLEDRGMIAYRGIGAGPVWIAENSQQLSQFPTGAVLVSHYAPPWLARAIPRANAIVTDIGATTGHMATVAREFRVPTIVGAQVATEVLSANKEVTVDAERNIIYEGRIQELIHRQLFDENTFEITHEFQVLRRLLKKIAPLSLIDPDAANFIPKGCKTLHDVMRFVHEKAFQALVTVGKDPRSFVRRGAKRLRSSLPLDLVLFDIGGGLSEGVGKNIYVDADQITSHPMKALWEGLNSPDAWSTVPIPVDFKGLMSSLTRTQSAEVLGDTLPGVNLAVIGSDYVNLSLPLGYHFTAVEASIGPSQENNYISFRFVGGVTDITRRSRRANLLMNIFEKEGFKVEVDGDLVIARVNNLSEEKMRDQLYLIGRLIGFARQLDVLLKNDKDIDYYFEKFTEGMKGPRQE